MIAKIVLKDREYYSYVFARFNPGFNESVIVFDGENDKFELLNVYNVKTSIKRRVFIIDTDVSEMVEKDKIQTEKSVYKNCLGYDWILDNPEIISQIETEKNVDKKHLEVANNLNRNIDTGEWKHVKNHTDANNLLTAAFGLHDATIADIKYNLESPFSVQILFKSCWNFDMILEFTSDILMHVSMQDSYFNEVCDSSIFFEDGFIYWVDQYGVKSSKDLKECFNYFRGRSLKWKLITN